MTDHMLWFLAAAAMVATVLTVGTLAAAEMMPWQRSARVTPPVARPTPAPTTDGDRAPEAA